MARPEYRPKNRSTDPSASFWAVGSYRRFFFGIELLLLVRIMRSGESISIWFFIGVSLLVNGLLILAAAWTNGTPPRTGGAVSLAASIWWGGFLFLVGTPVLLSLRAVEATIVVAQEQASLVRRSGRGRLFQENEGYHAHRKGDDGLIVGNGDFSRSSCKIGREEMIKTLQSVGMDVVVLDRREASTEPWRSRGSEAGLRRFVSGKQPADSWSDWRRCNLYGDAARHADTRVDWRADVPVLVSDADHPSYPLAFCLKQSGAALRFLVSLHGSVLLSSGPRQPHPCQRSCSVLIISSRPDFAR